MAYEAHNEECILVLAPRGRDAQVIEQVLTKAGMHCMVCSDFKMLLHQFDQPNGAALIVEEALHGADIEALAGKLADQPSWSDFPFVVLMSPMRSSADAKAKPAIHKLGNVIQLERPFNAETLRSAATSALRARRRQYQARTDLQERISLNANLETRIAERTAELALANDRLMREMTERERAQMALVQTQKMEALGHLTSGISHDFNNLLSIIQGNADLIDLLTSDERIKRMAGTIHKAAEQGAKMTGQLLAFSRAQPLDLKTFDLNKALENIQDLLSSSLGSGIRIELDLASGLPPVKADLNQIELAVLNLAINAKDAMNNTGSIIITTERQLSSPESAHPAEYAVVSVSDTGEGINEEILGKLFDPFFTTKPLGKGTGLGLSQVYGIAKQSGGAVKIQSKVGVGTTVQIWLPFAALEEQIAPAPRAEPHAKDDGSRACILVVEDDARVRQFIVESLEILGYQVMQAESALAALEQLERMQPDLLMTDFLMPEMTGAELIRQAHGRYPGLPALMATGYADAQAVSAVLDGALVLRKPFQVRDLAVKVQGALARAGRG